jgi:methylamine dehydrogenase light chain
MPQQLLTRSIPDLAAGRYQADISVALTAHEHERPAYRMGVHNDINGGMANTSNTYHCTVAAMVGVGQIS